METVSPVDLSVRTVRRSADSTAWRAEAEHDGDVQAEACDSTAPPSRLPGGLRDSVRVAAAPRPRRTAVMPRVPFMPDFSVEQFLQQRDAQREQQDQLRRQREDDEHLHQHPQVSLPGVATLQLPWPAIARPSLTGGSGGSVVTASAAAESSSHAVSHSHSALLPRFSSNRSSLYPSSSAPGLPPHAADPTSYLPSLPSLPSLPPLGSLPLVPPPVPRSAPDAGLGLGLGLGVPEAPRIRTKAEMKMGSARERPRDARPSLPHSPERQRAADGRALPSRLFSPQLGDAAAEAVRSWLATSQPEVLADPTEHPCEASSEYYVERQRASRRLLFDQPFDHALC